MVKVVPERDVTSICSTELTRMKNGPSLPSGQPVDAVIAGVIAPVPTIAPLRVVATALPAKSRRSKLAPSAIRLPLACGGDARDHMLGTFGCLHDPCERKCSPR